MRHCPAAALTPVSSPGFSLVVSLATNVLNLFVFFPWTHEVLVKYMAAKKNNEDEKIVSKARMNFGIVHGIANIINYVTMGANLVFIYKMTTATFA